jgi:hypothetical protein
MPTRRPPLPAATTARLQHRLVNVDLTHIAVHVPIGIAANVCDVNIAVLISNFVDQADARDAESISTIRIS